MHNKKFGPVTIDETNKYYETVTKFSWIYELWRWADENEIDNFTQEEYNCKASSRGLPRNKELLLHITHLDLSDYNLSILPAEIGYLTNLKELNISWNNIKELPFNLTNIENLEVIFCMGNPIKQIDKEILSLPYLRIEKEFHLC